MIPHLGFGGIEYKTLQKLDKCHTDHTGKVASFLIYVI